MPNSSGLIQIKRDLIKIGGTSLTAADWTAILKALIDDSIKGILRSIGDSGDSPTNVKGKTLLKALDDLYTRLRIFDADYGTQVLKVASTSGTVVLYTVPADKTLYIASEWLMTRLSNDYTGELLIRDENDNTVYTLLKQFSRTYTETQTTAYSFARPLKVPSSYDIVLKNDEGANEVRGGFTGWIE